MSECTREGGVASALPCPPKWAIPSKLDQRLIAELRTPGASEGRGGARGQRASTRGEHYDALSTALPSLQSHGIGNDGIRHATTDVGLKIQETTTLHPPTLSFLPFRAMSIAGKKRSIDGGVLDHGQSSSSLAESSVNGSSRSGASLDNNGRESSKEVASNGNDSGSDGWTAVTSGTSRKKQKKELKKLAKQGVRRSSFVAVARDDLPELAEFCRDTIGGHTRALSVDNEAHLCCPPISNLSLHPFIRSQRVSWRRRCFSLTPLASGAGTR